MTAKITEREDVFNVNYRKEDHFRAQFSAVVFDGKTAVEAVTLRLYSTKATSYACVWISAGNGYKSGSGKAGGYGYDRASAAAGAAIRAAGVDLSEDIDGRGGSAIRAAVDAIAKAACGDRGAVYVVEAYG